MISILDLLHFVRCNTVTGYRTAADEQVNTVRDFVLCIKFVIKDYIYLLVKIASTVPGENIFSK